MTAYTVRAKELGRWIGYRLGSEHGNTIDAVNLRGWNIVVTTRTPVDLGARAYSIEFHADAAVTVTSGVSPAEHKAESAPAPAPRPANIPTFDLAEMARQAVAYASVTGTRVATFTECRGAFEVTVTAYRAADRTWRLDRCCMFYDAQCPNCAALFNNPTPENGGTL